MRQTGGMHFSHHPGIWQQYPELAAGALHAQGIRPQVEPQAVIDRYQALARERLAQATSESELPQIQAWRRVFSRMGLKPTQYRCASESLLRRFKKEGVMPRVHPLVDICNAISMAYAIPVAALDTAQMSITRRVRSLGCRCATPTERRTTSPSAARPSTRIRTR